ncbi:MAG TPA: allantoicase [Pseudonocardiaceae bacterium]|jgi:allantoicase|nr:allantoicase [Pseudonocardiaceae bacterium]
MTVDWSALPDLASRRFGGSVVAANDEFFAERENLIKPEPPQYRPHTFTNKGQEYDGWETRRRRREPGDHDWAIIRLGIPGKVHTVIVDTAFFKGNHPPFCAIDGCSADGYPPPTDLDWAPLITRSTLAGDAANVFTVDSVWRYTHLRLRIFPDGGVARLRVHGTPVPDPQWLADVPFDLAAMANGGAAIRCSDGFFSPPNNMLQPGESRFMSDGWETARRRDNGHDWAIIRLTAQAVPRVVEIDTTHYKGNAPDRVSVAGVDATHADLDDDSAWHPVLPVTDLQPDTAHRFRATADRPVTHLRVDVFPDGGIGRFRAYGHLTANGTEQLTAAWRAARPV